MPVQESGLRPARAVPYALHVVGEANPAEGTVKIEFGNTGKAAAVFQVRSGEGQDGPWTFTVGAGANGWETWDIKATGRDTYDLSVYGPNGFFRAFKGSIGATKDANLTIKSVYDTERLGITLEITNRASTFSQVRIVNGYNHESIEHGLHPGEKLTRNWFLWESGGWYDLTVGVASAPGFQQQLAGHVETGFDSVSDPAIGSKCR
jgi:phospholipase C